MRGAWVGGIALAAVATAAGTPAMARCAAAACYEVEFRVESCAPVHGDEGLLDLHGDPLDSRVVACSAGAAPETLKESRNVAFRNRDVRYRGGASCEALRRDRALFYQPPCCDVIDPSRGNTCATDRPVVRDLPTGAGGRAPEPRASMRWTAVIDEPRPAKGPRGRPRALFASDGGKWVSLDSGASPPGKPMREARSAKASSGVLDPAGWRRSPFPEALRPALVNAMKYARGSEATSCASADGGARIADSGESDIRAGEAHESSGGLRLVEARLDPATRGCDAAMSPEAQAYWFLVRGSAIDLVGRGLAFVRAGDYDRDGKTEVLFRYSGPRREGYVLLFDDYRRTVEYTWKRHEP